MRILLIGTGTIGGAIAEAVGGHEVIRASRSSSEVQVDLRDPGSIRAMYEKVGAVDAVLCAAGSGAWKPLAELTDEDFETTLHYKLMGQVHVIRQGLQSVRDRGVIVVTSGILTYLPMVGSAAISLANGGLEAFVRAAALEAPREIRVNAVSPPWVSETLKEMGDTTTPGLPAASVARAYVRLLTSEETGEVVQLTA